MSSLVPFSRHTGWHPFEPNHTLDSGRCQPSGQTELDPRTAFLPKVLPAASEQSEDEYGSRQSGSVRCLYIPGRTTQLSDTFDPAHRTTFSQESTVVQKMEDLDPKTTSSPISRSSNSPENTGWLPGQKTRLPTFAPSNRYSQLTSS
jgi:hypothetical protein